MSHKDLLREVPYHNNEELVKVANDLIEYCADGLRSMRELHGDQIPLNLQPQKDFYKHLIATSTEYLVQTGNWHDV
jgi:hypothetical protein